MASGTDLVVVGDGLRPMGNVVRIVASGASKLAFARQPALQKALRFPKPVARVRDFEAGVLARFPVEVDLEVRQRLPRPIREWTAIEADDRVGKFLIRCFQMALEANLDLAIRIQARGVYNSRPHGLRGIALGGFVNMALSRPVAPLAVDSFRQRLQVRCLGRVPMLTLRNLRISVVAKHALVKDRAH